MSLHPQPIAPIPAETARVARAAFPKGTTFIQMRDRFGAIYDDAQFADLFPTRGQPAEAPWRLALICLMQFAEGYCQVNSSAEERIASSSYIMAA